MPGSRDDKPPLKEILVKFDYPGIAVFAAGVVALLLGLQFGGSSYSWSGGRTIASLTVAGALFLIFAAIEWWKGSDALVPGKIIGNRVVSLSSIYTSTLDGAYFILVYQVCRPLHPKCRSISNLYSHSRRFPCGFNPSLVSPLATPVIVFSRSWHPVSLQ